MAVPASDPVPWMVAGAEHSADVARRLAYSATAGGNGIAAGGDLKVRELNVPGTSVRIAPGGAVLTNKYGGGVGQTYILNNPVEVELPIPATGSGGGAINYVIAKIDDPQYSGQIPPDPTVGPYSFFDLVPSVTGLTYPHVVLAKIDQPASTGTITTSMITDMREVANPFSREVIKPHPVLYSDPGQLTLSSTLAYPQGEWFPNAGGPANNGVHVFDIPQWATRMQIRAEWLAVLHGANAGYGRYWVTYGPTARDAAPANYTQSFSWNAADGGVYRANWILHEEVPVPVAWRGTSQEFIMRANIVGSGAGQVKADPSSGIVLSVRFLQVAD